MDNKISLLGQNIKKIRKAKDIDRNKLSRLTGIENVLLYEIESGGINGLSPSDLEKIAKALDVDVIALTGEKVDYDINIYELIRHIEHEFGINRDYLTDNEKYSFINSLESAINIIKCHRNNLQ